MLRLMARAAPGSRSAALGRAGIAAPKPGLGADVIGVDVDAVACAVSDFELRADKMPDPVPALDLLRHSRCNPGTVLRNVGGRRAQARPSVRAPLIHSGLDKSRAMRGPVARPNTGTDLFPIGTQLRRAPIRDCKCSLLLREIFPNGKLNSAPRRGAP